MKYYLIAGENSGDLHASGLIRALKSRDEEARFRAWGGERMEEAGASLFRHYREMEVMGFVEVFKKLPAIFRHIRECKKDIDEWKPDVLILIDYPGFNMRMAAFAHERGIPVYYYILPQLWAWHSSRVKNIARVVDRLFSILPFEQDFYAKYGLHADFVGHPLLDILNRNRDLAGSQRLEAKKRIALLPGSRAQEIQKILPVMLELAARHPEMDFRIAGIGNRKSLYREARGLPNVELVWDEMHALLDDADAALVTSGTATLETALHRVPQVVVYKGGLINYWIGKRVVNVKYISLVNLILEREAVCELIQNELTADRLEEELMRLFEPEYRGKVMNAYDELIMQLGEAGVAQRTAEKMIAYLREENLKK